ncbi:hypothetical protein ABR737_00430 [Streptomyces sp. Edi2]|uniref:hypothetical protein n=1 Tax=Streptomyces sp. Edi2 TaxID=3162528 RepID=UPI0033056756
MVHSDRTGSGGPDYADDSLAIAYQWMRGKDAQDPAVGRTVLGEMQQGMAVYARSRGARLVGDLEFDFPTPSLLPRPVQREVLRAVLSGEWRPWRWPGMVLVRAWQDSEPVTD